MGEKEARGFEKYDSNTNIPIRIDTPSNQLQKRVPHRTPIKLTEDTSKVTSSQHTNKLLMSKIQNILIHVRKLGPQSEELHAGKSNNDN